MRNIRDVAESVTLVLWQRRKKAKDIDTHNYVLTTFFFGIE